MTWTCNVVGSGDDRAASGLTWIEAWRRRTGISNPPCSVWGCTNAGAHGAHVVKKGGLVEYIVPLCPGHNAPGCQCNVMKATHFISADSL